MHKILETTPVIARTSAKQSSWQSHSIDSEKGDCFVESNYTKSNKLRLLAKTVFVLFLLLNIKTQIQAQDFSFLPDKPRGMVNDYANMISSSDENRLEDKLRVYRDTTSNVIAIATIESLQGNSVEETASELFNKWRMWDGERYNGVLILIAKQDRKLRIEVGYGLEGAIPDAMANRIINEILVPSLRNNDLYSGLDRATSAMIQLASGEFEGTGENYYSNGDGKFPFDVVIIIVVIILFLFTRGGRGGGRRRTFGPEDVIEALFWSQIFGGGRNRGGGWGGGGGSSFGGGGGGFGGFSGGGGFGSGGGGASGGW